MERQFVESTLEDGIAIVTIYHSIGLINQAVPKDTVMDGAKKMAKLIAAEGPLAVRAAKKAINRGLIMPLQGGL